MYENTPIKNLRKKLRALEHQRAQILAACKRRKKDIYRARKFSFFHPHKKRRFVPAPEWRKLKDTEAQIAELKKWITVKSHTPQDVWHTPPREEKCASLVVVKEKEICAKSGTLCSERKRSGAC